MLKESFTRHPGTTSPLSRSIKPLQKICLAAIAATFSLAGAPALAQYSGSQEAQLQLKADHAALASERQQLKTDKTTLKADTRSGRMAAESKDSEKVYQDQQAIKGEKKVIAADAPDSLQLKEDKSALASAQRQLKADRKTLGTDSKYGKMAAESKDAESIYKDQLAVKGEKKDIAHDKAKLHAQARHN